MRMHKEGKHLSNMLYQGGETFLVGEVPWVFLFYAYIMSGQKISQINIALYNIVF